MLSYKSVEREIETSQTIEKSKFITYVAPCQTEEEAKAFVAKIRKQHSQATHNCYAYVTNFGEYARYSDDGEPQGTAGLPILDVIQKNALLNVAIVITRYFGGIKLGAGGLTRAYSSSASLGIKESKILTWEASEKIEIEFSYDEFTLFPKIKSLQGVKVLSTSYENFVKVTIAVKKSVYKAFNDSFCNLFLGKKTFLEKGEEFVFFEE